MVGTTTMLRIFGVVRGTRDVCMYTLTGDGMLVGEPVPQLKQSEECYVAESLFTYRGVLHILGVTHDLMAFMIYKIVSFDEIYRVMQYSGYSVPKVENTPKKISTLEINLNNQRVQIDGDLLYVWQYKHIVVVDLATMTIVRLISFELFNQNYIVSGGIVYILISSETECNNVPDGVQYLQMPAEVGKISQFNEIYMNAYGKICFRASNDKCYRIDSVDPVVVTEMDLVPFEQHRYIEAGDGISARVAQNEDRRISVRNAYDGSVYDLTMPDDSYSNIICPI